ncbi:hypothetical protein ACFQZ4_46005 [Catellatospora coxensis]|nr:hypothetical protein [Catellatospora coxensis]
MPALTERPVDFAYAYRMRCACGEATDLSADDYADEINEAHIPCSHCGDAIHFGRNVIALRDRADPGLNNEELNGFAWYHTSTEPDWPSSTYAERKRHTLAQAIPPMRVREESIVRLSNLALHVGTYEAAIENVLRRMRDQGEANAKFFLFRVALNLDPQRIEAGFRDENLQPAAQLSAAELRDHGLQAVRYLNVHESPGSLSLAVAPEAITTVQSVDLDSIGMPPDHGTQLNLQLDAFQRELDQMRAGPPAPTDVPTSALERLQTRAATRRGRPGGDGGVDPAGSWRRWSSVESALADRYLQGVNAIVARGFNRAMQCRRRRGDQDVRSVADFYATRAFGLTGSSEVIAQLASQPARVLHDHHC